MEKERITPIVEIEKGRAWPALNRTLAINEALLDLKVKGENKDDE